MILIEMLYPGVPVLQFEVLNYLKCSLHQRSFIRVYINHEPLLVLTNLMLPVVGGVVACSWLSHDALWRDAAEQPEKDQS